MRQTGGAVEAAVERALGAVAQAPRAEVVVEGFGRDGAPEDEV